MSPNVAAGGVEIHGLRELQQALRRLGVEFPRQLRVANLSVAGIVAADARSRASALGGAAAKSAASIKATAEQLAAKVQWGGRQFPFAGGAEFGAFHDLPRRVERHGRQIVVHGWNQFKPWRGNQHTSAYIEFDEHDTGYFVYPAIRARRAEIVDAYADAISVITADAFPD